MRIQTKTKMESDYLKQLIEQLGSAKWAEHYEAEQALDKLGDAATDAALEGLRHASPKVRRWCADFFDHHGDDRCVPALLALAQSDSVDRVRWQAVHSLSCQRCKASPLTMDLSDFLIEKARHDPSPKVRGMAVFGMASQPQSEKVMAFLEEMIAELAPQVPLPKHQWALLRGAKYALAMQRRGGYASRCLALAIGIAESARHLVTFYLAIPRNTVCKMPPFL
jgi:HEAT repeats